MRRNLYFRRKPWEPIPYIHRQPKCFSVEEARLASERTGTTQKIYLINNRRFSLCNMRTKFAINNSKFVIFTAMMNHHNTEKRPQRITIESCGHPYPQSWILRKYFISITIRHEFHALYYFPKMLQNIMELYYNQLPPVNLRNLIK